MRCMHEATLYKANAFITCTYNDASLPYGGTLVKADFQKFLKRLRKKIGVNIRYYMVGEYGEQTYRPHYHAGIFNFDWPDKKFHTRNAQGDIIYTSKMLDETWGLGNCTTAELNFQTAAYMARYCMTKQTGKTAREHYYRITDRGPMLLLPEYNNMSLKPGIGQPWLDKWKTDVYPNDYVIINGKRSRPPKYYDKLFEREEPDALNEIKENRVWKAYQRRDDNTEDRLKVKEQVSIAATSQLKRNLS